MKDNSGPNCSIVLVANKVDVPFNEREVTTDEGNVLAEKYGLEFYEVSATQNTGVDAAMNAMARLMTLKYETLSGDFGNFNAFNDARLTEGGDSHDGGVFKLSFSGGDGNCCLARNTRSGDTPH